MINSIQIQNFQNHKNTELRLSPGVNVIIGPSDTGKSAVLRALNWFFFNRPSGDLIRSFGGGDVRVIVDLEGLEIAKIRSKTTNEYRIGKSKFRAIGTDVPEEIKGILLVDAVNVQRQLDPPFLLSETSGNVAQHFNHIAQLDVLDVCRKNVEAWTRGLKSEIDHNENQLSEYEEELKEYDYLPKLESEVEVLEQLERRLKGELDKTLYLDKLLGVLTSTRIGIESTEQSIPPDGRVAELEGLWAKWTSANNHCKELAVLVKKCEMTHEKVEDLGGEIAELELEFKENMPEICPLCGRGKR